VKNSAPNGPSSENEHPTAIVDSVLIIDLIIELVIQRLPTQSIPSRPRSHAETGASGLIISYLPKSIFSPSKSAPIPPKCAKQCSGTPELLFPALLTHVYQCHNPAQQCWLPRPPIRHPRQVMQPTCSPKGLISQPHQPRHPRQHSNSHRFLAGGQVPIYTYEVSWAVSHIDI
jgi:hypothetical protein